MKIESIEQVLIEEVKDLYDAEKQLVKALPKIAKAASSSELKEAINSHLEETKGHVERLTEVFAALGVKAAGKPCAAMKGLVQEGSEAVESGAQGEYLDTLLIGAAQRVEHYEMAAYSTARTLAQHIGNDDVVSLLQQTLDEEKAADDKLSEVSMQILDGLSEGAEDVNDGEPEEPASARPKTRRAGQSSE